MNECGYVSRWAGDDGEDRSTRKKTLGRFEYIRKICYSKGREVMAASIVGKSKGAGFQPSCYDDEDGKQNSESGIFPSWAYLHNLSKLTWPRLSTTP
jgi:hypothetical protein